MRLALEDRSFFTGNMSDLRRQPRDPLEEGPSSHPLTPLQEAMLFHGLKDGDHSYLQIMVCDFEEPIDSVAFFDSWKELVERHDVLRTSFAHDSSGMPVQVVHGQISIPWEEQDWRHWSGEKQQSRFSAFLRDERKRGFDLATPPPLRLSLLRFEDEHYRLVWTSHHALFDGRSRLILLRDLFRLYDGRGRRGGSTHVADSLAIPSLQDLSRWLQSRRTSADESFWKATFSGCEFPCEIDLGSGRSKTENELFCKVSNRLSSTLSSRLRSLAKDNHLTLNTLLQGAWAILLRHYTQQEVVVFGATSAGRYGAPPELANAVGLLISTIPVTVKVDLQNHLLEWLSEIRNKWVELRDHGMDSLTDIRSYFGVSPDTQLFDSLVVFEKYELTSHVQSWGSDWKRRRFELHGQTNYGLTVSGFDDAEILLKVEGDPKRYDHVAIQRLANQVQHLLTQFSNNPHRTLAEIPLLEEVEQQRLIVDWNDTSTDYPCDKTVHELFEFQAELRPDAVAVVFQDQSLTYRELNQRANQLAWHLKSLGVEKGDLVGFSIERRFEMVIGLLGILKAGATYLPLGGDYPDDRLHYMLRDGEADVLVTWGDGGRRLAEEVKHVVDLETDSFQGQSTLNPKVEVTADDLAYVMYTSGTTGKPKGVMIRHRSIARLVFGVDYAEFGVGETVLQAATISFDASTFELWAALLHGGRLVLAPAGPPDLEQLPQLIARHQVSTIWLTTALFNQVIETQPEALQGVSQILTGGEALSVHHVRLALSRLSPEQTLVNGYGPTECTTFACCYTIPHDLAETARSVPIGRPIGNTQAYVLDRDLRPVPIGAQGELYLGGDGLAKGYWNRPELTAEKFVENPFGKTVSDRLYRTGDQVRWLNDGNLEFLGRLDAQIKLRGHRIELEEIAATMRDQPNVVDAVVDLREDRIGDPWLVAYYVAADIHETTELELRREIEQLLPRYMLPAVYVPLPSLPLTTNGKVDRRGLPAPDNSRLLAESGFVKPSTSTERRMAEIWCEVLGIEEVG
ncbi:MAG: amino acid adenylation domain-containing protein, partial [Pirellulaceae bacterium]|nr:amino acid adenylation domain-containing protein [Pirellulaceae bacterium]